MARIDEDLSKRRLHSKPFGRPIEICTKCGRKGEHVKFTDGSQMFAHKKHTTGMFWSVTDSCYIKSEDK
jgi:hypothetical protein